jgi:hypothetical protein
VSKKRSVEQKQVTVDALLARSVLGLVEAFAEEWEPDVDKRVEFQRKLFESLARYCQFTVDGLAKAIDYAKIRKVEHDRGH